MDDTERWYAEYYRAKGRDRNDLLFNPQVDLQDAAIRLGVVRALRRVGARRDWRILDVGCGSGASLLLMLALGFPQEGLAGIDLLPARIAGAKRVLPAAELVAGDASASGFPEGSFDLVMAHTLFIQVTDDEAASRIAAEMLRVTRPGGIVLLGDWRYDGGKDDYRAMSRSRIRSLFRVGTEVTWEGQLRGALIPPIGRTLSAYAPWAYFLAWSLLPPLTGHMTTILRKVE